MAKSSILDDLIEQIPARSNPKGLRLDRVLAGLTDCDDFDRLLDMLAATPEQWGHKQMAGIVRHLADHYGVDHENVTDGDISRWRDRQGER